MGNRNRPFFRVVAADGRTSTTGRFVETLGWYDPNLDGVNFKLKEDRIDYWEQNGAEFSATVKNLVKKARDLPPEAVAEPAPEPEAEAAPAEEAATTAAEPEATAADESTADA
jgi:small subunit ribosomal protein S16